MRLPLKVVLILAAIVLAAAFYGTAAAYDVEPGLPFPAGEKLTYRARWGFIPAGQVVMEVHPSKNESGQTIHHFTMYSRTSSQVDFLYPIRDVQHSTTDAGLTRTLSYAKQSAGRKVRNIKIDFNWDSMTATYVNSGTAEKIVPILPGTLDPLALIYALRLKEIRPGSVLEIPVTNGKGFNLVRGVVTGRETIVVKGKTYDTFAVIPESNSLSGLMEKKPKIKIWLSADKNHTPVKLRTQHTFGSLSFELTPETKIN
jgi:hypothetical protein